MTPQVIVTLFADRTVAAAVTVTLAVVLASAVPPALNWTERERLRQH